MTVKRIGHRYIDAASGKTLDVWFPRCLLYTSDAADE